MGLILVCFTDNSVYGFEEIAVYTFTEIAVWLHRDYTIIPRLQCMASWRRKCMASVKDFLETAQWLSRKESVGLQRHYTKRFPRDYSVWIIFTVYPSNTPG